MSARVGAAVHPLSPSPPLRPSHIIVRGHELNLSPARIIETSVNNDSAISRCITDSRSGAGPPRGGILPLFAFFFLSPRFPFDDCLNRLLPPLLPHAVWPVFDSNSRARRPRVRGMKGRREENVENFKQACRRSPPLPSSLYTPYNRRKRDICGRPERNDPRCVNQAPIKCCPYGREKD